MWTRGDVIAPETANSWIYDCPSRAWQGWLEHQPSQGRVMPATNRDAQNAGCSGHQITTTRQDRELTVPGCQGTGNNNKEMTNAFLAANFLDTMHESDVISESKTTVLHFGLK